MGGNSRVTEEWIKGEIKDFISSSELNTIQNETGEPAWDSSLVGFSSGADPVKAAREALERGELPPPPPPLV